MSTDPEYDDEYELEESPFDPDAPPRKRRAREWEPMDPMSNKDLEHWLASPWEVRVFDAFRCMGNLMADDGIGYRTGTWQQCKNRIADPTKSRYCMEHAQVVGVEYYSPPEFSEMTAKEVSANLTRLVPKAVSTLEHVMADEDAPPGIRAKAADSVLDRTGYAKGVDVRVDARVAVVDITGIIRDRLDSLRDSMKSPTPPGGPAGVSSGPVVVGETVTTIGPDDPPAPEPASDSDESA